MTRILEKQKAIELRRAGYSYSQIKKELNLSKSTLSGWLVNYPLSDERIRELRNWNYERIEKCRNTKARKKKKRLEEVFTAVSKDIGHLCQRDMYIAGFFLYWGEGGKTRTSTVCLTNSNPSVLTFFISWLILLGVDTSKLKIRLQIYADMDQEKIVEYWSTTLNIPISQFNKPQIKKSHQANLTYRNCLGKGTCTVAYHNRALGEIALSENMFCREYNF
jgi:hypothetical protein